ncbi:MAG: arginyl-tRNA synthetase [Bacteroidota bacterium]|nr:arginyl-tRNA synthetase [Bacteroidota bacterium]
MNNEYISGIFRTAINKSFPGCEFELFFDKPKIESHGDLATNVAMKLAKPLKMSPIKIAEQILANLEYDNNLISAVEIANPGFINLRFTDYFYSKIFSSLLEKGVDIGRQNEGAGKKVNVEYVSVNPTGLLHFGHARNAAIGDTVANLLEWMGWDVTREYYFNNAGNQMNKLASSIYSRYRQQLGEPDFPFPEDGYRGEYINEIAAEIIEKDGAKFPVINDEVLAYFRKAGEEWCFEKIKATLDRMNIRQEVFYNEDSLYKDGKIEQLIEDLKARELAYMQEGALWLALKKLGLNEDRVIVKSTGEPTYRLPDIAYHLEKFRRGFDLLIDVFGADHIATIPDVLAAVKAFGYDTDKVKVLIHQFITLTENGQQVKMSKRTGKNYTLDELLDEVGADVVRFFLLMRGMTTHLEFDLGLAREQSEKNPVFYLQYAHARICSIFENARDRNIEIKPEADLSLLAHPSELKLIKVLADFEDSAANACRKYEPQALTEYLRELAAAFHGFYHECRILDEEDALRQARFKLIETVRHIIHNGLKILGVSAPVKM